MKVDMKNASQAWCPMVRHGRHAANSGGEVEDLGYDVCCGSACAMWAWAGVDYDGIPFGRCGLAPGSQVMLDD